MAAAAAAEPATRPAVEAPSAVVCVNGRLALPSAGPTGRASRCAVDADGGRVTVTGATGGGGWRVEVERWSAKPGEVVRFVAVGAPDGAVSAEYVVRIPQPDPDPRFVRHADSLAAMYRHAPHVGTMLDAAVRAVEPGWAYNPGDVVRAQLAGARWRPGWLTPYLATGLLWRMDAGDWRERERAARDAAAAGGDLAAYLLLRRPAGLTPEQDRGIATVLGGHAVLTTTTTATAVRPGAGEERADADD